jgi:tetratricopeptide (TPR) repeat protein
VARITLCLIARDEEEMLPGCLTSVAGAVDEVVLVDTGSRDRTAALACAAGARVVEQAWRDDFSAPRNEALRHASGDWVLQLDCDERLAPGGAGALRAAAARGGFDVGMLPLHDAASLDADPAEVVAGRARIGPPQPLPRLLWRAPGLRWRGRVHEDVADWAGARGNRLAAVAAPIVHLGAVLGLRDQRAKRERNLRLLRLRCQEEPGDVTGPGYLAMELLAAGLREEAARVAEAAWQLLPAQPPGRAVQRIAAARAVAAYLAGDARTALESAEAAACREELGADLRHLRGWALARLAGSASGEERRALALRAAAACAEAREPAPGLVHYQFLDGATGFAAWADEGEAWLLAGRPGDAAAAFERALRERPELPAARLGLAEARLEEGDPAGALRAVEPCLGDEPDGWVLAAAAGVALGARADARTFLDRARQRAGRGFGAPRRAERLAALTAALGGSGGRR